MKKLLAMTLSFVLMVIVCSAWMLSLTASGEATSGTSIHDIMILLIWYEIRHSYERVKCCFE